MKQQPFDFAVFGATPLAQLLAGLLANVHGRKVLLVGQGQARYRLLRGIDLSVAPMTRPESWAMLAQGVPETAKLVSRIGGRGATGRVDPIMFASGKLHTEALSHIRNMAVGFGLAAETISPSLLGEGRQGIILRDAIRINRPSLESGLERWLEREGVRQVAAHKVAIAANGEAEVVAGDQTFGATQAVLADDDAIMSWLPVRQWPTLLRRQNGTSILTTSTKPMAASLMLELDTASVLSQQAEGGIAAFGPGDMAGFSTHLQTLLGRDQQVEQAGQTRFQALATTDGAPAFGRAAGIGADIVAGLGFIGAFLAPALARWIAGSASPSEARWFEARLVNRVAKGAPVDEYAPGRQGEPA
ncbi:hypothetical protein SAMN06295905_0481 [Devosia lucknowensis]|uniref:Uncharacterized protein n=1 Tax=Devosia lucknowensis TaxID=1096929 RepID=A0A1Y6EEZ6_9HYPH|nr:hypothetical protein [Devosia lucknowensis]SMQ61157.1 hypothetical protein SAMN06295905_0481 [Devosia lucknowensis]